MKKRIFLLPGYGEDAPRAFRELAPFLNDFELIPVDFRPVLRKTMLWEMTGENFAKNLIRYYKIKEQDLLVGHSMGGYFSYQIREIAGNEICMLGSFSDPGKVIHMTPIPVLTPVMAVSGLMKTPFAKDFLKKRIQGKPFEEVMLEVVDNFKTYGNDELFKLSLMTLENKKKSNLPNPLRLHDKSDRVVRQPDEEHILVPGGHFTLNLHPELVFEHMKGFLYQ
jgi:hypothetical protein